MEFKLQDGDYIELVQLLKRVKITMSGGEAKMLIAEGQVKRNGVTETRKRAKIRVGETVETQGKTVVIV
ncbi:MAG: RNA-binding S4 domain-containing protein [Prevotellaceae bacterium]|jgi:ribosome-associated protein|nr:RNA-binding S4 domain-containing protein [Prevotellaceae bacterium]